MEPIDDDIVKAMERGDFRPLADWIRDRQAFGLRSERAARAARKIAPKEPTANDYRLARASLYYEGRVASGETHATALGGACKKFGTTAEIMAHLKQRPLVTEARKRLQTGRRPDS